MRHSLRTLLALAMTLLALLAAPACAQSYGDPAADCDDVPDSRSLSALASKVKSNFARESDAVVLAPGQPPLTMASVRAFAELMRLTFDVEMSSSEFEVTRQQFVHYYQQGDEKTKQMLALGWQSILAKIESTNGDERQRQINEVGAVFFDRFEKGARAGTPWYVAMWATIQRRLSNVARVEAPMPAYARQAGFNQEMTQADLDAALEMLYFMWVACGRDASAVTPDAVEQVRASILQGFSSFSPDVQYVFANAQHVYASLRGQWAQATPDQRMQMAAGFSQALDALGLTEGGDEGGGGNNGGAWSDVSNQSHSDWAASMVQGLAGSSYRSSW